MAKNKDGQYWCTNCGNDLYTWAGQCPHCDEWGTVEEKPAEFADKQASAQGRSSSTNSPKSLEEVDPQEHDRLSTRIDEFDFVLGGGIVPGSIVLLGGEPGIGKSTILTQVAARLQDQDRRVLYASGEESAAQVKLRAERLGQGAEKITFVGESELGGLMRAAHEFQPEVLMVDSIQTLHDGDIDSAPGNLKQVRECSAALQSYAKQKDVAVFLIGHVTKGGSLAGPKTLEHIVDTVVHFEQAGRMGHRIMRATKNRFGSVDEIGVFQMTEEGLQPVENPSGLFISDRQKGASGSVITATMEGSRPLMVEVQGLSVPSTYGSPQRVATGYSRKRLSILLAVLEKRLGLPCGQLDAFLNIAGGLTVKDTAGDGAAILALVSSFAERAVGEDVLVVGEVGLGGEFRAVAQIERRLKEAGKLGFKRAYVPRGSAPHASTGLEEVVEVEDIAELISETLGELHLSKTISEEDPGDQKKTSGQPRTRKKGEHRTELDLS